MRSWSISGTCAHNCNHRHDRVQLRSRRPCESHVQIPAFELADAKHADHDEYDDKAELEVGEQAVDAEHEEDGGIVGREVGQIVVDSILHHAKVGGLGKVLDVEEFADGLEIGEPRAQGCCANGIEACAEAVDVMSVWKRGHDVVRLWSGWTCTWMDVLQAARERVNRDVDACHDGRTGIGRRRW